MDESSMEAEFWHGGNQALMVVRMIRYMSPKSLRQCPKEPDRQMTTMGVKRAQNQEDRRKNLGPPKCRNCTDARWNPAREEDSQSHRRHRAQ